MIKHKIICDRCKCEIDEIDPSAPNKHGIWLKIDRVMDAAGSLDDEMINAELCPDCLRAFVYYIFKHDDDVKKKFPGELLKAFMSNFRSHIE